MSVPYEKYHGTDNDFVIVDAHEYVPDRGALAREACNPRNLGADGVLFLALEAQYTPPRVVMTLVQPDGSTAAMCGNGARCAAHWAAERTGAPSVMVDTQAGTRHAEIHAGGDAPDAVTIEMGVPTFDPDRVPVARERPMVEERFGDFAFTAVDTGVPHAVAFVDDIEAVDVEATAPAVRHADAFPQGTNVTFAARRGPAHFAQRTFERGVEGETRSCGTGAVAVAAVAERLGLLESGGPVRVSPPGGDLEIAFTETGAATLHGPVEREFAAAFDTVPAPRRRDRPEA